MYPPPRFPSHGRIIDLDENFVPTEFKYKSTKQKCYSISCKCGIVALASTLYVLIFYAGYRHGHDHMCNDTLT